MGRKPRFTLPGHPQHIVQRGLDRQSCFFSPADCTLYLELLAEAATRYDCQVHAYVLMTNHVHLLVTQQSASGVSFLMQRTGQRYVRAINRQYRRSGTLWDGRYKAGLIDTEAYLLTCMRYIELNPVRARMVRHPAHYSWSSYHCNGEGKQDKLITPHTLYLQLGRDREARCRAYRDLCSTRIEADTLNAIRNTTQQELVLGSSPYRQQIERMLKRQTEARPRGRPRIKHSREY
ncbi:MAG: transposase [Gammaproteobacteria bacterium]|jgi:putative transposase